MFYLQDSCLFFVFGEVLTYILFNINFIADFIPTENYTSNVTTNSTVAPQATKGNDMFRNNPRWSCFVSFWLKKKE